MRKIIATILTAIFMLAVLAACGANNQPSTSSPNASATGKLAVVGSTSVGPLMEKLEAEFKKKSTGISVQIQQVGSSAGIQATIDGSADIGMSSRDLTQDELAKGFKPVNIALDGIAVIVNKQNTATDLTTEQITKIFKGDITNWKEVGGADKSITVISREEGSGTRAAFEELMKLQKEVEKEGKKLKESIITEKALIQEGTGSVKAGVAGNPDAIGYISLGVADDTVKAVKVNGVEAKVETVKDKTYLISRPFVVVTKGEPKSTAKTFIDYLLSDEAQKLVEADHYISVK